MSVNQGDGKGTTSIWTAANVVTCVRIALMPVWLLMAEVVRLHGHRWQSPLAIAAIVLFATIMLTDSLDGWLARSRGEVTDFGKVMDPLADKISVVMGMAWLMECGILPSWMLLLVTLREFLVSGLRMLVARDGIIIPASNLGKYKTSITMVGLVLLMVAYAMPAGGAGDVMTRIGLVVMWVAMLLTAWSGIDYLQACWPSIAGRGDDGDDGDSVEPSEEG